MSRHIKEELNSYYTQAFGIDLRLLNIANEIQDRLKDRFNEVDTISAFHQGKVLKAFQEIGISDNHFSWNTGYGYDDIGREAVERVFAKVFGAEKALVRPNIVNGTHAISLALLGILKRGDKVIYCTGAPYDTLQSVTGYKNSSDTDKTNSSTDDKDNINIGTLKDLGVQYEEIDLLEDGNIDLEKLEKSITPDVKMVAIQRSKGYSWRNSITVNQIREVADLVHDIDSHICIMVDNCYCEFVEADEPIEAGADIICGSLIKNPGGGLALSGGYLCGRTDLIDMASYRLTCPGIGAECGLTFGQNRNVLQGLFLAPSITAGAVKGAIFCGNFFDEIGFDVSPDDNFNSIRADIIQAVEVGSIEAVKAFCLGIQKAAPIDSKVTPVPAPMPGYDDDIIMAAGTFVQGSSIELSADGPLREPYTVYFQGGLTFEHSKLGTLMAAQEMLNAGIFTL